MNWFGYFLFFLLVCGVFDCAGHLRRIANRMEGK